jgi:hypothetical protein
MMSTTRRRWVSAATTTLLVLAICMHAPARSAATAAGLPCGLAAPAFCETFDEGPSAVRGRAGDLDPTRWGVGRLSPQTYSLPGTIANPAPPAPVPPCRASLSATSVYPPNDTLICDPTATRSAQLMTAVSVQNYGMNSYLIRQPFDFQGRVGKIVFDVDAVTVSGLAGFVTLDLTDTPVPAPTFHEFMNFEHGPIARNGVMIKWSENCLSPGNLVSVGNVMIYTNYVAQIVTPSFVASAGTTPGCAKTLPGSLNHFEVDISAQHINIYASDYSPDDGQTFPNFHQIYSADVTIPFTRAYVHVAARDHATKKYGYGPDWVYHWDNIGFDGPIIQNWRAYEVADNTTTTEYPAGSGTIVMNLGYQLLDGTTGKPAGIYDPVNAVGPLQIPGVNPPGETSATLSFNMSFNAIAHVADTTWGISYRFNGGTWHTHQLTADEVGALNAQDSEGNIGLVLPVPVADLRTGTNTLDFLPVNAPMDMPPVVANIDLFLYGAGYGPAPPANLRIVRGP